ncbi:DNA recombination protein RmuC [Stutzerimonas kirkiae]|uniref:DNA recombination protein RmuC n=1 Tax=Stutzerimonas kirkiae TaxID=2211392 RepID=A0A4Q9R9F7_9GAMM|nr:DNA recombination protein RmuC [Stutzerimonas kirkiae]TBU97326.1 DNA recombination protein RmuC [Stutzerimonas kirkiae]TBV02958.1 DNA recombination protein RmuC [Stutzerimonas kirkiae]TBV06645.1 DNA recombination protein RmuC [Stutzerimonas kirkiae]TBV13059.1 DNA recombination protein RmuC [Stutzerimonas kirkiae]
MPVFSEPMLVWSLVGLVLSLAGALLFTQRRLQAYRGDLALAQERLEQALLAQQGLRQELDGCRLALADCNEVRSAQQAELLALRRENGWLQEQAREQRETLGDLLGERDALREELRTLSAQFAAQGSELREQRASHQQRLDDLQNARDELRAQFAELAGRIFDEREQRFADSSSERLGQLLEPLKERIQSFEKRVEESYQSEARERFSLAGEIQRLQQLNQRLGDEATNLTRALKGQKTQGNWGELVLERVLEQAGLVKGREYQTQASFRSPSGERFQPDVLISLPGERQVVVDAKVSLNAYQTFIQADDDAARTMALKQHVLSLRNHLKGLSFKDYQQLEGLRSLDFVLLFVPVESAFATALQAEPTLVQEAYDGNILIVSPTTLLATLRVIENLWRQERQNQNAREIAEKAGALYDKFSAFVQDLDEVGSRLQQLDKAYQAARSKLADGRGNLVTRAEQLRHLGARASKRLPTDWLERGEQ